MYSPVPVATWTGFYVGGNAGYGWTKVNSSAGSTLGTASGSFTMKGMIAGGQIGGNFQSGIWVVGLESDFQGSWQKLSGAGNTAILNTSVGIGGLPISETDKVNWFGTTRFRAGAAADGLFVYGTGGLAYGDVQTKASFNGTSIISGTTVKFGWVLGAGVEAMLTKNWTAKVEYLHLDFGGYTDHYIFNGTTPGTPVDLQQRVTSEILRFGVNYYFR